jgi:hypothetical protein
LEACESLLEHTEDQKDRKSIENEIAELKMALDLMPLTSFRFMIFPVIKNAKSDPLVS